MTKQIQDRGPIKVSPNNKSNRITEQRHADGMEWDGTERT